MSPAAPASAVTVRPDIPSPTPRATPRATRASSDALAIGTALTTARGNELTLHDVTIEDTTVSIDVEGCTGDDDSSSLNPFDFTLQMEDNTRLEPSGEQREPALHHTELLAHDCVRGFVTFEIGESPPAFVVFSGAADIAKWEIH